MRTGGSAADESESAQLFADRARAANRHFTLSANNLQAVEQEAIQRSVDMLALLECHLFGTLAVFNGGFSLEAAETVWDGPVLHLLRSLDWWQRLWRRSGACVAISPKRAGC